MFDTIIPAYTNLYFPVVGSGLLNLFPEFEWNLGVLEGAESFHHDFVSVLTDDYGRLGYIADLPRSKRNTCCSKMINQRWMRLRCGHSWIKKNACNILVLGWFT